MEQIILHYDERGACETEIQADKTGLKLAKRRKKNFAANSHLFF